MCVRGCLYDLGVGNGLDVMSAFPGWNFPDEMISPSYIEYVSVLSGGATATQKDRKGWQAWQNGPAWGMRKGNWSQIVIDIKLMTSSDTMMRLVDIADGDCDFVSDHDKDYSLVFGEARMRLHNTRYAVYLCVCMHACSTMYQA